MLDAGNSATKIICDEHGVTLLGINLHKATSGKKYAGTYAQDMAGFSDEDIDVVFDGEPGILEYGLMP